MTERDQRTFWRQPAITRIGVMTVCLLVVLFMVEITGPKLEGAGLIAVGSLLALLPAALWLTVFHLQQRAEPQHILRRRRLHLWMTVCSDLKGVNLSKAQKAPPAAKLLIV